MKIGVIEVYEWGHDPEVAVPSACADDNTHQSRGLRLNASKRSSSCNGVGNRRHCGRCIKDHNEVPRPRRVSDRDALHTVSRDLRGIRCSILEGNGNRVVLERVDTLLDHLENFLAEN